jgi:hypothetical protein
MTNRDTEVVRMYTCERLSVQQISSTLKISAYGIGKILRNNNIKKRSISDAATCHHITQFGLKEFKLKENLTREEEQLRVAGAMLYWGEGAKSGSNVALSNSDPRIIKIFLSFLRLICGVSEDRLHVSLHYYQDQDPSTLITFWADVTRIPASHFYKPHMQIRHKGTYRALSKHGTVIVTYSDRRLLKLLLMWMDKYYADLRV